MLVPNPTEPTLRSAACRTRLPLTTFTPAAKLVQGVEGALSRVMAGLVSVTVFMPRLVMADDATEAIAAIRSNSDDGDPFVVVVIVAAAGAGPRTCPTSRPITTRLRPIHGLALKGLPCC